MVEAREDVALAREALAHGAGEQVHVRQLEGHVAVELAVGSLREPDHAHPAGTDFAHESIVADRGAGLHVLVGCAVDPRALEVVRRGRGVRVAPARGAATRRLRDRGTPARPASPRARHPATPAPRRAGRREFRPRAPCWQRRRRSRAEHLPQQQARLVPVAADGAHGDVEDFRDLRRRRGRRSSASRRPATAGARAPPARAAPRGCAAARRPFPDRRSSSSARDARRRRRGAATSARGRDRRSPSASRATRRRRTGAGRRSRSVLTPESLRYDSLTSDVVSSSVDWPSRYSRECASSFSSA